MKVWYRAVCDEHKEICDCMVDGPRRTAIYLARKNGDIQAWFALHNGCRLRLIRHDHELDECWDGRYTIVTLTEDDPEEYQRWIDEVWKTP